jgi:hypothetical protein
LKKLAIIVVLLSSFALGQSTPPPNCSYSATDTFVRANASTLGSNWEENPNATYVWSIGTNTAYKSTGQFNADAVYWVGSAIPDNQCASVKIASVSNTNQGAAVRITQGSTASRNNGYHVRCSSRSSSACTQIIATKVTNSAHTTIITVNGSWASWTSKYIQISAEGSNPTTVKIYVDGTQIGSDYVDSTSPWTTGKPGMMTGTTSAGSAGTGANYFEAGSMGSSAAAPTFSPVAGTFTSAPQSVTISTATSGATICYTTDGSAPAATGGTCTSGSTYSSAVSVGTQYASGTVTLKALASKSGIDNSAITSGDFVFQYAATPTFVRPQPGVYFAEDYVELACSTASSTIRYTTNGSTPTGSSTVYSGVSSPTISSVTNSGAGSLTQQPFYKVTATNAAGESLPSVEVSGPSNSSYQATISWGAVAGATGYKVYRSYSSGTEQFVASTASPSYVDTGSITPSGALPTLNTSGTIATGASGTKTIKAICQASGYGDSNVLSGDYLINPSPVTLASDDFSSHFQWEMDAISVPGYPLDTWWTDGRWRSNSTWKLTASRVPSTAFIKAGGAGHGATTTDTTMFGLASYSGRSFPDDQWSKGKISGTQDAGVCVRLSPIGVKTGYCFRIARLAADAKLYKFVSDAETTLASPSPGAVSEGADIELRAVGNQLFAYLNGSIIATATDSAITSGQPGILAHKEHLRTAETNANPNSGIYSWSAGGFGSAPTSSTVYISEGTLTTPTYAEAMDSTWAGLYSAATVTDQFPWVSGAAKGVSEGTPPNIWGGAIRGYTNAGISGVGLNDVGKWMSSTTMQYRQPFGDSQWEQVKITADSSEIGLNNWFLMLKSILYIPGQANGGCTAAGTAPVCFDHVAYYLGVQTMATSIYTSDRAAICQAFQGVKTEYSCTPFLHITKVTPARNDDAVISVVGSLYTPMAGDYVRGEYDNGRLRAYCKNGRTYASWEAGHAYTKGQVVLDSNGNTQIVKTAGTSGGSTPSWPSAPEWDPYLEGTTTTDNTVTWMYFGEPCPTTDSWSLVFEVIDNDLVGLGGYPGLFLGGATDPGGSNAGWGGSTDPTNYPKAVPFFTDWSAGTLGNYAMVPDIMASSANVSDTATTSDSAAVAPLTAYTKTETVTASDALGRIVRLTKPLADSSTVGDTINIRTPYWVNKADSVGVADALVASRVGATQEKTLVDVMAAAESGNATTLDGSGLSGDSSTVGDSISATKIAGTQSFIRNATETVSAADTLARVAVHSRSASVTVGVGDGLNSETSGSVSQNENAILADTVAVQAIHPNSLADENNVGDVIAVYVTHPTSFKKKVVVIS